MPENKEVQYDYCIKCLTKEDIPEPAIEMSMTAGEKAFTMEELKTVAKNQMETFEMNPDDFTVVIYRSENMDDAEKIVAV